MKFLIIINEIKDEEIREKLKIILKNIFKIVSRTKDFLNFVLKNFKHVFSSFPKHNI